MFVSAKKPWPTQSLPSTSYNSIPNARKGKSIYTNNKVSKTKSSNEDKENGAKVVIESSFPAVENTHQPEEQAQEKKTDLVNGPEAESVLDHLDKELHVLCSDKVVGVESGTYI